MKFSFVIPTVKQTTLVRDCIASIRKHEDHNGDYEIIVVEDGSDEETQNWLRGYCDREGVKFIAKKENRGFSHTVNVGMKHAVGDYIVLLNNDVLLIKPILSRIESAFQKDPKIGVVGAKLLYPDMRVQHAGVVLAEMYGRKTFLHANCFAPRSHPAVSQSQYFISVTGALYVIRRKAYEELGSFNESYFLSCEDTEYSLRCWQQGWRVFYAADVEATHQEGGTRGNNDETKLKKGRQWFLRERETLSKFNEDLRKFSITEYQAMVEILNMPVTPGTVGSPRILVKRAGALGDVLQTTPIVRRLREVYGGEAVINVATASPMAYANNPHVNAVLPSNTPVTAYDKVVDLDLVYERAPEVHVIDAYSMAAFGDCDYDRSTTLNYLPLDDEVIDRRLAECGPVDMTKAVVIHMAVTWKNRTWPLELWRKLIDDLNGAGIAVIQVGAGSDFVLPTRQGLYDMTRRLTIPQVAALIARARCFIGNDSGLLHVAGTTKTPIVGIFTSVRGQYRVPFREGYYGAKCAIVEPDISCKGCHHRELPPVIFSDCRRGDYACLGLVTPGIVKSATMALIGEEV